MEFDRDILTEIIRWLKPVDVYYLSLTTKINNTIKISKIIIREINKRLWDIFGDDLSLFKESLFSKKIERVISGSFLIQCILGEVWIGSAIDIFHSGDSINSNISIFKFLNENPKMIDLGSYKRGDLDVNYITTYGYGKKLSEAPSDYTFAGDGRIVHKTNSIKEFYFGNINNLSLVNLLNESFDFDVCKNYYFYDGKDNIKITNINAICNKIINLKDVNYTVSVEERCHNKYKSRGFKFVGEPNIYNNDGVRYTELTKNTQPVVWEI